MYIASKWTEDLWGLVAGIGIGSIAVGFAARDSIENLFGTFTVLLDKPFQVGDWILVGDLEGTVEDVGFRSTRIRTFYNSLISVPNRTFISSNVDNMGQRRYRRIREMLGLTYDTPPEKIEAFCEGVRRIIATHPYTRKDYYHVYFNGFGPSSLDVLLYCFVETPDWSTELREKHKEFWLCKPKSVTNTHNVIPPWQWFSCDQLASLKFPPANSDLIQKLMSLEIPANDPSSDSTD